MQGKLSAGNQEVEEEMIDPVFMHTTDKEIEFLRGIPDGRWKAVTSRTQAMKALTRYRQIVRFRSWVGEVLGSKVC